MPSVQCIRACAMHYLSPEVASYANMSLHDMQQFIAGSYWPTDVQLQQLARRINLI